MGVIIIKWDDTDKKTENFSGLEPKKDEIVRMKYLQRLELIGLNLKDVFSH